MKLKLLYFFLLSLFIASCKNTTSKWQKINMGFNDNFHDIAPINKNTAIAYSYGSGLIVRTEDQGKTWQVVFQTDSIYFEQIEFPSSEIGFICGNTNKILKTEDGGKNWIELTIYTLPESAPIYGMKFLDTQTGYLALMERTKNGFESKILHTTNSGENWNEINHIPEMLLNIEIVNNEIWASGNNVVLKNIDKRNWQVVYKDTTKQVGQIRDFLIHDKKLIMCSFNGFIICKQDSLVTTRQITKNRIRSIISTGTGKFIVAGDNDKEKGNLFESVDNGESWKLFKQDFNDLHRLKIKDGIIWGVGKNDQLIKMFL